LVKSFHWWYPLMKINHMKYFHTIAKWTCVALDVCECRCWDIFDIKKVLQTQRSIKSFYFIMHYSFGKLWSTRRIEKVQNPREVNSLCEVSIAKVILQAWDILTNGQRLFHPTSHQLRSYLSLLLSDSFCVWGILLH